MTEDIKERDSRCDSRRQKCKEDESRLLEAETESKEKLIQTFVHCH